MEKELNLFSLAGYSPLVLAYLGDAYFELLVRRYLIGDGNCRPADLNRAAREYVTAMRQSEAVERMLPMLTEREESVYKSGRNAKSAHTPRSADVVAYRRATGLETLFGFWYLIGDAARAERMFSVGFPDEKASSQGKEEDAE